MTLGSSSSCSPGPRPLPPSPPLPGPTHLPIPLGHPSPPFPISQAITRLSVPGGLTFARAQATSCLPYHSNCPGPAGDFPDANRSTRTPVPGYKKDTCTCRFERDGPLRGGGKYFVGVRCAAEATTWILCPACALRNKWRACFVRTRLRSAQENTTTRNTGENAAILVPWAKNILPRQKAYARHNSLENSPTTHNTTKFTARRLSR